MKDQEVKIFRVFPPGKQAGWVGHLSPYKYGLILQSGEKYAQIIYTNYLSPSLFKICSLLNEYLQRKDTKYSTLLHLHGMLK